jgi:hypothetical protein
MARRMAGMMGMPDMSGMMGGAPPEGGDPTAAPASGRKKLRKKPRHKKRK